MSAYNAGVNTVQTYDKMDIGKTHNYANDMDTRARFCKINGYWELWVMIRFEALVAYFASN